MESQNGRIVDIPNKGRSLLAREQISTSVCVTQAVLGLAAVMDK